MGDQQLNFPEWETNQPRVGTQTKGAPRVSLSNQPNTVLVSLENSSPCVGVLTQGVIFYQHRVFSFPVYPESLDANYNEIKKMIREVCDMCEVFLFDNDAIFMKQKLELIVR